METSRRAFVLGAAAASAVAQERSGGLTAKEVIARIQKNVGVPWREPTVDTLKSGSPDTAVKGIATTMMATLDVVQKAAAAGRNMVITHEPTFYSHEDKTDVLKDDPTYRFKQAFLDKHEMVVFRFHDHWHAHRPDGIATGMIQALGWEKNVDPANPRQFLLDRVTLGALAGQLADKLHVRTMRVIGDPTLPVRTVSANWGYNSSLKPFSRPDLDVLIIGEAREWELIEYAADTITSGRKKGLIVLGHIPSEQSGMVNCANWLKTFVTEVPVEFIPAAEPFWRPGAA
ncbi:MAG TPA: Nif3-like dinuclear metal center hexameric protein [Candidatus Sulfopaludibacter sp.]|jgi:putative NIF3 family GTP cyclohydrolase 1 type 2|nr:Nif3-like dinuclear metal center hexameric protein [Candidatus Sulfopaludibacter sp.]